MDQENGEEELKPSFRIRFTINSKSNQQPTNSDPSSPRSHSRNEPNNCDQATYQECEIHDCDHTIDDNNNHHHHHHHHHHYHQATSTNYTSACSEHHKPGQKKKLFKFIKPQNHKSSLFVNLSDINNANQQNNENHLFISPDLNQVTPATPPSPAELILFSSGFELDTTTNTTADRKQIEVNRKLSLDESSEQQQADETSAYCPIGDKEDLKSDIEDTEDTMSQSCNFINSWMYASRRRSASVTPTAPTTNVPSNSNHNNNGRRTSSSHDLAAPISPLADRSASGNHLAINASNETICPNEPTHTNRNNYIGRSNHRGPTMILNNGYIQHSDINMRPTLENYFYQDNSQQPHFYPVPMSANNNNPSGDWEDNLELDLNNLRLEEECRNLENDVQEWEKRVGDMERARFQVGISSTLVESVLAQRKRLRDLEFEIYKLNLVTEESEKHQQQQQSQKLPLSQNINSPLDSSRAMTVDFGGPGDKLVTGKFGSHIRPGQENTADILDAIPPSGSLQHKQYLTKASTGTDSSDYTQLPTFEQHRHQLPPQSVHMAVGHQPMVVVSSDDSGGNDTTDTHSSSRQEDYNQPPEHPRNHHQHYHQSHHRREQQQQQQQDYVEVRLNKIQTQSERLQRGSQVSSIRQQQQQSAQDRSPPIQFNHHQFETDFRQSSHMIPSQDSTSNTPSDESAQ